MIVLDTSGVVDLLLAEGAAERVLALLDDTAPPAAPDVLVFETLAVLRRRVLRGELGERRAAEAVDDLGDLPIELVPSLGLREAAWALRANLTVADGLFVALAQRLGVPLATKDARLADAARGVGGVDVVRLAG